MTAMSNFTPFASLLGGALIGLSASLLLLLHGEVAGVSGIVGDLVRLRPGDAGWRAWFAFGLVAGGAVLQLVRPSVFGPSVAPLPSLLLAGVLVGFGTRLGSGCTSGHGVCGLSRRSVRSLAATLTFMATAGLTTFVVRHALVAGP